MGALAEMATVWMLALGRVGGLFVFAPVLASVAIPVRARVLLAAVFGVVIYRGAESAARRGGTIPADTVSIAAAMIGEVSVGAAIGLIALLPIAGLQTGAAVLSQQVGFALGAVYNPALETESDPLSDLLSYLGLGVFMAMGGIEAMFIAVARSVEVLPPGAALTGGLVGAGPWGLVVPVFASGLEIALRVSAPVMAVMLLETVATSILSKTLPSLNVFSVGLGLKVVIGLGVLAASLAVIEVVVDEEVGRVMRAVLRWSGGGGEALEP